MGQILPIKSGGTRKYIFKNGAWQGAYQPSVTIPISNGKLQIHDKTFTVLVGANKTVFIKVNGKSETQSSAMGYSDTSNADTPTSRCVLTTNAPNIDFTTGVTTTATNTYLWVYQSASFYSEISEIWYE